MNSGWNQSIGTDSGQHEHEVNQDGDKVGLENFEFRELLGAIGGCTPSVTNNEYSYGSHHNTASVNVTEEGVKPVEDEQLNVALFSNEWGKSVVNQTKDWDLPPSPQHSPNTTESGEPEAPVEQPSPSTDPINPGPPEHWNYKSRIGTWGQEEPSPAPTSIPSSRPPPRRRSRVESYLHPVIAPDNSMRHIRMYRNQAPFDDWRWDGMPS